MFIVIVFMFAGLVSGYLFRKIKLGFINKLILILIWLLLFLLGVEVGLNDQVVSQFPKLGFEATMIAVFATLGSIIGAKLLWGKKSKSTEDKHIENIATSFVKNKEDKE